MDYIIDPMWFYWLQVVDMMRVVITGGMVIFGVGLAFCVAGFISLKVDEYDEECEQVAKYIKRIAIVFAIVVLGFAFIPSKRTLIEMEVAKHATYSNVESIKEQITDAADYILDRLEGEEKE